MNRCYYCRWGEGFHAVQCPNFSGFDGTTPRPKEERLALIEEWHAGWDVGRAGEVYVNDSSPAWSLGYGRGVVALEEAKNGHDPRFE